MEDKPVRQRKKIVTRDGGGTKQDPEPEVVVEESEKENRSKKK